MKYYGIDIHKKYSVYTAIDERGVILEQGRIPNEPQAFARIMNHSPEGAKAVIEATCNWYYIHDILEGMVAEVCVAHPLRTRAIASARVKTDKVDATTLAQLLRADLIPHSYVPRREVRELRELLRYRASLVRIRTRIKNKVHALLTKNGLQHPFSDLFGKAGRKWLASIELRPVYRNALEGYLRILDSLDREILPVTKEINAAAPADARVRLLISVPGIGYYTALLILSEIGDIDRFPDANHLVSYAGLNPSVHSSGGVTKYGRISKQGSAWLRWVLTESASIAARRPGKLQSFHRRIARRHGAKTANIALAREILRICYYLLKKGERYQE
jgi:transposase